MPDMLRVFADGHATFFGPLFHLVILFLRDPGVQMQGTPGIIFRSFLLFLHNLLPFKSMRACERSGAIVGQAASRIVRHWYFSLTETGAVCSRQSSWSAVSLGCLHFLFNFISCRFGFNQGKRDEWTSGSGLSRPPCRHFL